MRRPIPKSRVSFIVVFSVIAGYLLPLIGIHIGAGFVRAAINAFIGACVLLVIVRLVKR
jgi:uncharacterized membrane protein YeaQ/YmgE (transglycosylase-associated protein family)